MTAIAGTTTPTPSSTTPPVRLPRAITVTATTNTKTYDGNTTAAATPAVTTGTIATGDTANFTEAYSDKNAGVSNKTLVPSGTVTDGNGGANYNVTFANFTTGTINAATLTASIIGEPTKPYNGNTIATLTSANFSISGLVGSESFTVTKNTGTYNSKDVLTAATVTASLVTGDFTPANGAIASNYAF